MPDNKGTREQTGQHLMLPLPWRKLITLATKLHRVA